MPLSTIAWIRRVFRFPVFLRLWRFMVVLLIYSLSVELVFFVTHHDDRQPTLSPRAAEVVLTTLLFTVLLRFRTETAYHRWYEARILWGQLVNVSRNLALKTRHVVRPGSADDAEVRALVSAFARDLRTRLGAVETRPGHQPMRVVAQLYDMLDRWNREGKINTWQALAFDEELRQFMVVCGACERIRSTPLTASYRGLLRKGIAMFLVALPWLIIDETGLSAVPITLAVGYVLIALELIADDIEEPFGYGPDDLPLDDVVKIIERSMEEETDDGQFLTMPGWQPPAIGRGTPEGGI